MRHKLIFGILTIILVGSLAGITAFNSLQEDKSAAVGKAKIGTQFAISAGAEDGYGFLNGYLRTTDRKAIVNAPVTVTSSNGQTQTVKTNSEGNFGAYKLPLGETITLKFAGDKNYAPCELSYENDGENHKRNWVPSPDF